MRTSSTIPGWDEDDFRVFERETREEVRQQSTQIVKTSIREVQDVVGMRGSMGSTSMGGVRMQTDVRVYSDGVRKSNIELDGDVFFGGDLDDPAGTSFSLFAVAQDYNYEDMPEGNILIGDNSDGKANVLWDAAEGRMLFRLGQIANVYLDSDGELKAGAGAVIINLSGIHIYEQAGDVNGQIIFHNDAIPANFGGITMWNENFMRMYYKDIASGQSTDLRIDKDAVVAQVNTRFRVVYEPTTKVAASLSAQAGQEGLTIYDVSDGTTNLAEILKGYWAMKAVAASPSYSDGYGRLFLYDDGTQTELRLRIKDGTVEKEHVLGAAGGSGSYIEARDAVYINADTNTDTHLKFREASVTQADLWYDADLDNFSIEHVTGGGIILVMKGSAATESVAIYDRTNSKDRFKFFNNGTLHILEATTATPSYVADTAILFYDGAADKVKLRTKQGTTETEIALDGSGGSGIPVNGWVSAGETWTYASASTFTVSGDVTAKYHKGTRLKWTQTTVKYGVVQASSHAAGTTTVTIFTNTDYTLANAAITANYYSYVVNPEGYPDWFNYTPTYSGSGSMTFTSVTTAYAKYRVIGQMVVYEIQATGTTGGTASNTLQATAPATPLQTSGSAACTTRDAASGTSVVGTGGQNSSSGIFARKADGSNYGLGTGRILQNYGFYDY